MDDSTLHRLLLEEIQIINSTLRSFKVDAGTHPSGAWTTIAGTSYIAYGLRRGATQTIDGIEKRLPELTDRISRHRRTRTPVALRQTPLALETLHPAPVPLAWIKARLKLPSFTMLAGRNYMLDPAVDDTISLRKFPHALVAGTTGSGKSTLVRMMLCSLAINTHPDDLSMVLIDMKNSDLATLRTLPHVQRFAVMDGDAAQAVRWVESILRQRIERQIAEPKLLLAIDELRELARLPGVIDKLGSIVSLGRSLGIHVIGATQHPKAGEIGSVVKANFPLRLVGQVVGARHAEAAADRPGTGAELLPGEGAFLRIDGPNLVRLQAYWLDDAGTQSLVDLAKRMYGGSGASAPVRTGAEMAEPVRTGSSGASALVRTGAEMAEPVRTGSSVQFPLPRREPTPIEAMAIRALRAECSSINETIRIVYGAKNGETHRWVSAALAMPEQPQREFRIVGRTEEDEANAKAIDVAPQAPILKLGVRNVG